MTRDVVHDRAPASYGECSVSESDNLQKRTLECVRFAADCMQLAGDAHSSDLQSHFLRMAGKWEALADQALSAHTAPIDQSGSAGESDSSDIAAFCTVTDPVLELVNRVPGSTCEP